MKRIITLMMVLTIAVVTLLAGCSTDDVTDLEGVRWILTSYGSPVSPQAVLENAQVTARFNSGTKELRGNSGCNTYSVGYEIEGNTISLDNLIVVTEMWCGDEIGDLEAEYLDLLIDARSFDVAVVNWLSIVVAGCSTMRRSSPRR